MKTRYPGAQPFSTEQQPIFFGREQELDELHRYIQIEHFVVLYAKSGLGKSSLLNAGLIPLVADEGKLTPISIRFGAYTPEKSASPLSSSNKSISQHDGGSSEILDKVKPAEEESLWYHLKTRQLTTAPNSFLLVFDQFEELFTYPEEAINEFSKELSELLYTTIPDRFRKNIEYGLHNDPSLLPEDELKELHQPFEVRIIMAIRSDRMSLMNKLKPFLAGVLDNCYELRPLSIQEAESAILSPAYLPKERGPFKSPVFDYEDEAIASLIDFLSKGRSQPIESFELQILCEYAERQIVRKEGRNLISENDVRQPELILENYYLDKINGLPKDQQLPARRLIEEGLVFEEEERRLTLYGGQIARTYGISPALLDSLLDTHLIRSEPSIKGGYTYELSHDTLVDPVLKAKNKRLESERIIAKQEAQKRKEEEMRSLREKAEKEKALREKAEAAKAEAERLRMISDNRLRTVRGLLVAALVAVLVAVYFGNDARQKTLQANADRETAEKLLIENIQKDSMNRIEKYNRFLAEAQGFENQKLYERAIERYEIAKEFTEDTLFISAAIEKNSAAAANSIKYRELVIQADSLIAAGAYEKGIEAFSEAIKLNTNDSDLRFKLSNLRSVLRDKANRAQTNADALSFDPAMAQKYRQQVTASNRLIRNIQALLTEIN